MMVLLSLSTTAPGGRHQSSRSVCGHQTTVKTSHSYLLHLAIKFTQSLLSPTANHQSHIIIPISYKWSSNSVTLISYTWPSNSPSHSYLLQQVIKFTHSLLSPTADHQIHKVTPISYSWSWNWHSYSCLLQLIIKLTQLLLSPTADHQIDTVTPVSYSWSSNWHSYSCLLLLIIKLTQLLLSPTADHEIDTVTPVSYSWSWNWHSYSYLYKWSWSWPCHSYLLHLIIKVLHVTPISYNHQSSPSHSKSFTCILKPTRKMTVWRSM